MIKFQQAKRKHVTSLAIDHSLKVLHKFYIINDRPFVNWVHSTGTTLKVKKKNNIVLLVCTKMQDKYTSVQITSTRVTKESIVIHVTVT